METGDVLPGLGELPQLGEQRSLLDAVSSSQEVVGEVTDPVAHVHVEMPQPHMDRVFDYLIPAKFDEKAVVGARVTVDVGQRQVPGFIVGRSSRTNTGGALRPLRRVVSPLPVLTEEIYELSKKIAARQAAAVSDVLRLAVPQRHARAEAEFLGTDFLGNTPCPAPEPGLWSAYRGGPAFITRLREGKNPRAVCAALPGRGGSIRLLAIAAEATVSAGRSVLMVAPTSRDATRLAERLRELTGQPVALMLSEDQNSQRYRAFLEVLYGQKPIVVGTRAALWAPVRKLGLCVVVDDAAETLREVRSPYCTARDVLAVRAEMSDAAMLVYSPYVSEESAALVASGFAALLEGTESAVRSEVARVSVPEQWEHEHAEWSRVPESAFNLVRQALGSGPILVLVPRSGYLPLIACARCQSIASCALCGGTLALDPASQRPRCERCGDRTVDWQCAECGGAKLRAVRIGSHRTAEEFGKAFPGTGVLLSGAQSSDGIIASVSAKPRIVVATPGAEPVAEGGYAAALVLDSRFLKGQGLGSETQFVRRAARVVVRVRPARAGGHVMFVGGADQEIVAALNAWNLGRLSRTLLKERVELRLPPASRWLGVTGAKRDVRTFVALLRTALTARYLDPADTLPAAAVEEALDAAQIPLDSLLVGGVHELVPGVALLGPAPAPREQELTIYLRTDVKRAVDLTTMARSAYREYCAKNMGQPLKLEVDPAM
ncbi:primosomal protein N' [Actinomycetaceae bacterium L2_0104]